MGLDVGDWQQRLGLTRIAGAGAAVGKKPKSADARRRLEHQTQGAVMQCTMTW